MHEWTGAYNNNMLQYIKFGDIINYDNSSATVLINNFEKKFFILEVICRGRHCIFEKHKETKLFLHKYGNAIIPIDDQDIIDGEEPSL